MEFNYVDTVKMAGHACPTVSAAYLITRLALAKLYDADVPVRGEIAVTIYGEPNDGVYGVMAQVFSYLTGAASETGFKGLASRFKRQDLLQFNHVVIDPEAMCFEFRRLDNGKAVLARFYSQRIPFPADKSLQIGRLLLPVVSEAATEVQRKVFQDLWMDKIVYILSEHEVAKWLQIDDWGS